ncbi:MAG TPA: aldo/keto reductase [Candidatus Faecaligallichristensenella faecipullorum]|nr:aldo/keto reductase [Candidatus Faecaligallichristensenella faecipullorum]
MLVMTTALFSVSALAEASESASAPVFDLEQGTVLLNSGYTMPIMGLGTYSLTDEECYNSVTALLEAGGRLIDTAYMYHNEASVGRAVRASGVPREEVFITTKLYPNQYDNADRAIDEALRRLDTGYIDMMLLHHPAHNDAAAYGAIERAVRDGRVRCANVSCYYIREIDRFLPKVSLAPALVQNELHPYYQDSRATQYLQGLGLAVQAWYPLGGRGYTERLLADGIIREIAAAHQKSPAQVILRWNLQRGVAVIPGSGNPEHIRENLSSFDFELTGAEMEAIRNLNRDEKHDWY